MAKFGRCVRRFSTGPAMQNVPAPSISSCSTAAPKLNIYGVPRERLRELLVSMDMQAFRGDQLYDFLYRQLHSGTAEPTNLSKTQLASVTAAFSFSRGAAAPALVSADGTRKWLLRLPSDAATVEMVYIPEFGREAGAHVAGSLFEAQRPRALQAKRRATLCVSSQVGCSLACKFCHTGTQKLQRNASAADIVLQVVHSLVDLQRAGGAASEGVPTLPRISNIVFMGQGEPGYNWKNVRTAISILCDPKGLGLSPRRITVSTAGVAPIIPKIATEAPGVKLAVSLHAPNDALRSSIMNINTSYPLAELMSACRQYLEARLAATPIPPPAPSRKKSDNAKVPQPHSVASSISLDSDSGSESEDEGGEGGGSGASLGSRISRLDTHNTSRRARITFEYVMLDGVNDSQATAAELGKLLTTSLPRAACHINLIPFNSWPGAVYTGTPMHHIVAFQNELSRWGIRANIRRSRGMDILGACGQLKSSAEGKAAVVARVKVSPEASSSDGSTENIDMSMR